MNCCRTNHRRPGVHSTLGLLAMLCLVSIPAAAVAQAGHEGHDEHEDHETAGLGAGFTPTLTLHGFSDMVLRLDHTHGALATDSTTSGFALGQFDLYLVSRLAENLSFLGESVFELAGNGETAVDVERVYIRYAWSDFLHLAAGRTHTALGYWNEVFHHGGLLQPTVERPEALKFEDDGGILPVHSVGVEVGGKLNRGDWDVDYVGNLANGRGAVSDAVQGGGDLNRDKAIGVKLSLAHTGSLHFAIGPSFYRDVIPPDPLTPGREGEIAERITGVHAHVSARAVEALAEYYNVRHEDQATAVVHRHDAWYGIVVVSTPHCKPYAGVDRLAFSPGDLFYASGQRDLTRGTLGVRFQPSRFNAVKLEYRHDRRRGEDTDALLVQTAFTF